MHWNKALYNFRKRGQRSIVSNNMGLEYALLVASNYHMSATLSHPLWKNVNDSKCFILAVPISMSFKVLKYFSVAKRNFFYLLSCGNEIWNRKKLCFFSWPTLQKAFFTKKWWFVAGIYLIWRLMEYTNDHSPDASIIMHP